MRIEGGKRKCGGFLIAVVWALTASSAGAVGTPGPSEPDVFSGDFGIQLAKNEANGESVLGSIEDLVGAGFPWIGGFSFPASLPPLPALPTDVPGGLGSGVFSLAEDDGGGGSSVPPVPEPAPAILLGLGLAAVGLARRKRAA